ncbi:MAG: putative fructokinase [Bryobacterales bacterium]|nr:putative fructokinase [Bryobacterales bacterium]
MASFGGIEAGGTNFVCAAGSGPDDVVVEEFPTLTPGETIARVGKFFRQHAVAAIGIGCFGPIDIARGRITTTPKLDWQQFGMVDAVREAAGVARVAFDTDVNAAALGEYTWGAARGVDTFVYLTVGTGIGGGAMVNGNLLHGLSHPEMGHIRIPHDLATDPFPGACYAHGDCLEGLASGFAIEKRWGLRGELLQEGHPAWALEATHLANGVVNFICTLSPRMVIMGGSVMRGTPIGLVSAKAEAALNGYLVMPDIVPPALGERAGVLGAIALVQA